MVHCPWVWVNGHCTIVKLMVIIVGSGLPRGLRGKESTCQCRKRRRRRKCWFDPWVGKIPWRRKRQLASLFLPVKLHGQRSLDGLQSIESQKSRT